MRILGLDPSLSSTGWGVIEVEGNRMRYVADGFIKTDPKLPLAERLALIYDTLRQVIETYHPDEASIEQVFLNDNPKSTIKLGMARGVVMMMPALYQNPIKLKRPLSGSDMPKNLRSRRWLKFCSRTASPKMPTLPMLWLWRLRITLIAMYRL